jgi:hypothetical protein
MFVGSSYNETLSGDLGDTLSQVSDKSSNYFTSDIEHRNRQYQVRVSALPSKEKQNLGKFVFVNFIFNIEIIL